MRISDWSSDVCSSDLLATWTPPKIRKLIEEQRDYAATVLTVEAVADFWRLPDFARRKARAFAGVTQIAMLQSPELNSKSANPMVGDARSEMSAEKAANRPIYLRPPPSELGQRRTAEWRERV